jgi:hypothetical protein
MGQKSSLCAKQPQETGPHPEAHIPTLYKMLAKSTNGKCTTMVYIYIYTCFG